MLEYVVRGLVFPVPKPSDECPDHKARVRLSFLLSLLSRLVAQWLNLIQHVGVPRRGSNSSALSRHSIRVLLHNFCSTWLVCRRTLCCHRPSDFWGVSQVNSSWIQVTCTDGLLALSKSESSPNQIWTSRQLSDQAWMCPVNLPVCRVTHSRNQADRMAG